MHLPRAEICRSIWRLNLKLEGDVASLLSAVRIL